MGEQSSFVAQKEFIKGVRVGPRRHVTLCCSTTYMPSFITTLILPCVLLDAVVSNSPHLDRLL